MKSYDDSEFLSISSANMIGAILLFFLVVKYYRNILFHSVGFPLTTISTQITIILSIILIINDLKKYNIFHFILLVLFFIQFKITNNNTIIYIYTLALGLYNRDLKKILKLYIVTNIIFFLSCLILNLLGIKPSGYIHGRNNLGFSNPNAAYMAFFIIWASYLYVKFDKMDKKGFIIILISPLIIYAETRTQTGLITVFICIAFVLKFRRININKKIYKYLFSIYPILLTMASLILTFAFNNHYWINEYLSHRPYYWNKYLTHPIYGLNLMGYEQNIRKLAFYPKIPLDSGYIWTLYSGGILVFLIIILLYMYAIYRLCCKNKKAEVLLILSILTYSFAESILLNITINLSFICIPYAIGEISNRIKIFKYK
ncbi:hypothetical protein [Romboutsia lituseburensis]|uniref:O-antigen ligase like membrane protein n=1 Tax=Romboutsia lituseburensis DSM 797 TaxID=1121325 RepID=A0A1G9QMG4_9FIRM|nr:hypothetical protein [Romboutsia lituseburensis]CEH35585.1 Hypothetical protein RLITU_3011 [Romboutsia lituseburensis]SDM12100.1 hypothetical protein SAMN04515677_105277 [Romboutsia lituseburensis DSM 797]